MEINIQEGAQTAFNRCCEIIDDLFFGKTDNHCLTGLQASGKSTIVKRLIEKYGADKIAHCSADIHMGDKFNPLMIERVHKLCQKDCFEALRGNRFPIIDNTSLIADHRSVYKHISREWGLRFILLLWLVTIGFTGTNPSEHCLLMPLKFELSSAQRLVAKLSNYCYLRNSLAKCSSRH